MFHMNIPRLKKNTTLKHDDMKTYLDDMKIYLQKLTLWKMKNTA
jgi:hypothetical protein